MFGEDEDSAFREQTFGDQMTTQPSKVVVSNGLFGGTDLKEDETGAANKASKSKLNSIFDYEEEEEETK